MMAGCPACRQGRPKDSAKREEIVLAATQLFLENGFGQTSMEAVARKAGVSKLTIYSHFADKKDLFRAIVQARCDKVGMPTCLLHYLQLPVEEALLTISQKALAKILTPESIRLIRVIHAEALQGPEIPTIYYEIGPGRVKAAFTELLREYDKAGKLCVPNPERASEQFFCLLKGDMLQRALLLHTPLPTADEIDVHIAASVAFFLSVYKPLSNVNPSA